MCSGRHVLQTEVGVPSTKAYWVIVQPAQFDIWGKDSNEDQHGYKTGIIGRFYPAQTKTWYRSCNHENPHCGFLNCPQRNATQKWRSQWFACS